MPENINDMAIPEMKLVQAVGGDEAKQVGAKVGDFYCPITQEIIVGSEGFDIVVSGPAQKTRTYWGKTEITDEPPKCASMDGVTSITGCDCKTACPFGAFNDAPYLLDAAARRAACTPNYTVIGIKVSDMMPILVRCSGISSMAAKELNTLIKFHKAIKGQYYKAMIRVFSIKKKTGSGEAYAIKFGNPAPIQDLEMINSVREQLALLAGVEIPPDVEELEPVQQKKLEPGKESQSITAAEVGDASFLGTGTFTPKPFKEIVQSDITDETPIISRSWLARMLNVLKWDKPKFESFLKVKYQATKVSAMSKPQQEDLAAYFNGAIKALAAQDPSK